MPENEMSNSDLLEQSIHDAYEELNRLKFGDENRGKVLNEIKILEDIQQKASDSESARLNNNARNDIEESKLEIERQKVAVERKKVRSAWRQTLVYAFVGTLSTGLSFFAEPWFQKNQTLNKFSDKVTSLILRIK